MIDVATDLRALYRRHGLDLDPEISGLRPQQEEALEWAKRSLKPYLLLNAPTGSGKTLILSSYGLGIDMATWTYGVHTIRLQEQVASTFISTLPVMTGRANHPCLIGEELYGYDVMADKGICAVGGWCAHTGKMSDEGELPKQLCSYYAMRKECLESPYRTANYAVLLTNPPLLQKGRTEALLADEAHNIEEVVANIVSIYLSRRTFQRFGIRLPGYAAAGQWQQWAERQPLPRKPQQLDFGWKTVCENLAALGGVTDDGWVVSMEEHGVKLEPVWGTEFVQPRLFGHTTDEHGEVRMPRGGVKKVLMTSATLMGADYIADKLGLPEGSWDYLDLPSTFPPENRPINYAPVVTMNNAAMQDGYNEVRAKMMAAVDRLIEHYVLSGAKAGLIHGVSNKYVEKLLTESRWKAIMTKEVSTHVESITAGRTSVLVAANLAEGWDGKDDLCRFVIFPKAPFPNLGDARTRLRMGEDGRSFDHRALVTVVQGAGRGVRHVSDTCDTWLLDGAWKFLYNKRKAWLPNSFLSAYHHGVPLP